MTKRICPVCGEAFTPANGRQRFCGVKCHQKAKWARIAAAVRARRLAARANRVCPVCGKVFTPKNSRGKYCSAKCSNARFRVLVQHDPKPCAWCGREFTPVRTSQIYCSRECNLAAHGKSRKGAGLSIRKVGRAVPGEPLASLARVRAYLSLPPAERWARRGTLTQDEHKLAQKLYLETHSMRTCSTNDLAH
jgi:predicted nucleic acid-binding Zn ribbon protein